MKNHSGSIVTRPGLEKVKEILRSGDTLVVWRLDRLGRSLKDLIAWASYLEENGIGLVSLQEFIDTTGSPRLPPPVNWYFISSER